MLRYGRAFADYHIRLVESASNARLLKFYRGLSSNLTRYKIMYLFLEGSGPRSIKDHHQILDLIKRKAYGDVKRLMRKHFNVSFGFLQKKIYQGKIEGTIGDVEAPICDSKPMTALFNLSGQLFLA